MGPGFDRKLRQVWLRCHANLLLDELALALTGAGVIAAIAVFAERLLATGAMRPWMLPGLLGAAAATAMAVWLRRRPSLMAVAVLIDDRLNLRERFSTALALAESPDPFAVAACAEARQRALRLDVKGKFGLRLSRRWLYSLSSWIVAGAVVLFLPTLDVFGHGKGEQTRREQAQQLQQAQADVKQATQKLDMTVRQLPDPELSKDVAKLDEMKDGLKPEDIKRQAIRKLEELADKIKRPENFQRLDSMKEMQGMLKAVKGSPQALTNELNRDIAKGDFSKAAGEIRDLQKKMEEGKLSDEQKKALGKQLQDLANQLENLAGKNKGFQEELEKNNLNKDLAKLPQKQLEEALKKQGLSDEKIKELMDKAAACRLASAACHKLGTAMAACESPGNGGQASSSEMAELADQLDELETLKQELALTRASLNEINKAIACLGQCQGPGGVGEWEAGDPLGQGPGTGRPGIGYGPRPSDDRGDFGLEATKLTVPNKGGPAVASWYFKGPQVVGESGQKLTGIIQASRDAAAEAINENEIPRKYEGPVKKYFGNLEESSKPTN